MLQGCYGILGEAICNTLASLAAVFAVLAVIFLIGAALLLFIAARQMRDIDIPPDADFFETMRLIPITIPIALDLLDFVFDIFAAPLAWIILESLGLKSLQFVTVTEGIIPGTQPIPTLTLAWVFARMTGRSSTPELEQNLRSHEQDILARRERRKARRRRIRGVETDIDAEYEPEYVDDDFEDYGGVVDDYDE